MVKAGSFTLAGERLGLSKSLVSQHVTDLEEQLMVRLLNRTTRSLSVTEEGSLVFQNSTTMLDGIEGIVSDLEARRATPAGSIRLTSSQNFASNYLVGCISRFCENNRGISVDLIVDDAILNMIEERFDVAFRVGWLEDSSLHAVKICDFEMLLCASPHYLEQHGPLAKPCDLSGHPWVAITLLADVERVSLYSRQNDECRIPVTPRFKTNSGFTAKHFVMLGMGVGLLPNFAVAEDLQSGRLVRILPEWHHRHGQISAIYVHRKQMPSRVRSFLNFMKNDAMIHFPPLDRGY